MPTQATVAPNSPLRRILSRTAAPAIGEIIGGSQREDRLDLLNHKMEKMGIDKSLWWYRDLRRYGSVPHSGFGLGFERLISYITGMENIRDVTAFPRTPDNASF